MKETKFTVRYRRRREGKTNYKKRLKLLMSKKPRLVLRISLKGISIQIIEFKPEGDVVLLAANSKELNKFGWKYNGKNTSSAYLTGLIIGKKAAAKGIKEAVLDIGLKQAIKGSRLFACLKGAVDGGLDIRHSKKVFPKEDRIKGKHIEDYANKLKAKKEAYQKKFAGYIKAGIDPIQITKVFDDVKKKIME
ncbi:50S ribosomal protein L18 [Candidatus Woesearchaeota archaeon]|nr:50S ribosomal protein L18 [Candidatus Woesearchaeota archaeon]